MRIVDEDLLNEFRGAGKCEWCGFNCFARSPHHLWARGMGGGGRLDVRINLASLCWVCHADVHNGAITRHDLLAVVSAREGKLQHEIEEEIWRLRREPK